MGNKKKNRESKGPLPLHCTRGRLSFRLIQENRRACLCLQCTHWINKELINFFVEIIVGNDDSDDEAAGAAAAAPAHCKVSEQKETVNGLVDDECGEQAPAGYAGLCRLVCYCSCLLVHCYFLDNLRNRLPLETGGSQQNFILGGLTPYPFTYHFSQKRYPFHVSIDKWYPFHIPCLELCSPFNCCKCTLF